MLFVLNTVVQKHLTIIWDHFHLFNCCFSLFEFGVGDLKLDIPLHVNFGFSTNVVIEVDGSKNSSKIV